MAIYTEAINSPGQGGLSSLDATIDRLRRDKETAKANEAKLWENFYGMQSTSNFLGERSRSVAQSYMSEFERAIQEHAQNPTAETSRTLQAIQVDAKNFLNMAAASRAANLTELKTASENPEQYVETLEGMMQQFKAREEGALSARWNPRTGQMEIRHPDGKTQLVYDDPVYSGSDPLAFTKRKIDAVPATGEWAVSKRAIFQYNKDKNTFVSDVANRFTRANSLDANESPYVNAAIIYELSEMGADLQSTSAMETARRNIMSDDKELQRVLEQYGRLEGEKLWGILKAEQDEEARRLRAAQPKPEKEKPLDSPFGDGVDTNIPSGFKLINKRDENTGQTTSISSTVQELYYFDKPIEPQKQANFPYLIVSANVDANGSIIFGYVEETEDWLQGKTVATKYSRVAPGDQRGLYTTIKNRMAHMYDPLFKRSFELYQSQAVSPKVVAVAPPRQLQGGGIIKNTINSIGNFFSGK
jgi:hypothetical protein